MTTSDRGMHRPGLDRPGVAGMFAVGIAAAVLSFDTWTRLAEAVGFTGHVMLPLPGHVTVRAAWLLPVAIDCYTLTVIRVWLRSPAGSAVIAYAKGNALTAIVLSVAGQAAYHAFTAAGAKLADLWWFAIIVGGIPPALLGLVMDLYTRLKHDAAHGTAVVPAVPVTPDSAPDMPPADDTETAAAPVMSPAPRPDTAPTARRPQRRTRAKVADRTARPDSNAARVAALRTGQPDITQTQVAEKTGLSVRTVARHWQAIPAATDPTTAPVNGHPNPELLPAGSAP